jgi:hypothetical protein
VHTGLVPLDASEIGFPVGSTGAKGASLVLLHLAGAEVPGEVSGGLVLVVVPLTALGVVEWSPVCGNLSNDCWSMTIF